MAARTILAVDDEVDILELLGYNLTKEEFRILRVTSGQKALEIAKTERPDLIILDLMLPGLDGLEVCKHLRSEGQTADIPIVMLTAKGEEAHIVVGLELGADDYVTKPFSPRILTARVRTVLRRRSKSAVDEETPIGISGIDINPGRHEILVDGKPVKLTSTEYEILS